MNRGVTLIVCAFCGEPTGLIFDTKSNKIERSTAVHQCPTTHEEEEETVAE
jgi:CO dehydrogenase/acetyl-CoA synthase gamma subunit (corrinoid Fe-S protein)